MNKQHPNELAVPPDAMADEASAHEIFRAWTVNGGLQVSLVKAFDNPAVWGLLLIDIARHAARIYAAEGNCSEAEALDQIQTMWDAEMGRPTDTGSTQTLARSVH